MVGKLLKSTRVDSGLADASRIRGEARRRSARSATLVSKHKNRRLVKDARCPGHVSQHGFCWRPSHIQYPWKSLSANCNRPVRTKARFGSMDWDARRIQPAYGEGD